MTNINFEYDSEVYCLAANFELSNSPPGLSVDEGLDNRAHYGRVRTGEL